MNRAEETKRMRRKYLKNITRENEIKLKRKREKGRPEEAANRTERRC